MKPQYEPAAGEQSEAPAPEPAASLLECVVERSVELPARVDGIAVGILRDLANGVARVDIPMFGVTALHARTLVALDANLLGQEVALGFEAGNPRQPIILGPILSSPVRSMAATVDGKRLELTAEREIELRCGDAAITLSADGRILLRGTYVTSYASATQRILGGSVNVN